MRDRHLNLFYTYGGSARWEDNFTRAFLVTLANLTPVHFRLFLRDVLLSDASTLLRDRIELRADDERFFDLQVSGSGRDDEESLTSGNGVLVTIDTTGLEELTIEQTPTDRGSRIDAILEDSTAAVTAVIEVKLREDQSGDQLSRHHRAFFDPEESRPGDVHAGVKWEDVVEYLAGLRNLSAGGKEEYVLSEFVEYADLLGLAPFKGFEPADFDGKRTSQKRVLRKFLQLLEARHGEELGFAIGSAASHRLDFDDVSENIWIDYSEPKGEYLRVGVVGGADGIRHMRKFRSAIENEPDELRAIGNALGTHVEEIDPSFEVMWRPLLRFYGSRGQQYFPSTTKRFSHPTELGAFVDRMTDRSLNPCDWVPRAQIEADFEVELSEKRLPRGEDGHFPPWEEKSEVLVSSFFDLAVFMPQELLINITRDDCIDVVASVLKPLREAAYELNKLKHRN